MTHLIIALTLLLIVTIVIRHVRQPVNGVALMRNRTTGETKIARVNDRGVWFRVSGSMIRACPDTWELVEWL